VVSFTPWLLYPQEKSPQYALYRRLGGQQSRSGRRGTEKNYIREVIQALFAMSRPVIGMKLLGKMCLPMWPVCAVANALYSVATQPQQQQERVKEEQYEQEDGKNNQKARKSKR
jgi:hypothetical protein